MSVLVLVVDDDPVMRELLQKHFTLWDLPLDFTIMDSALEALIEISSIQPDLLITDGEASLIANPFPVDGDGDKVVEGWLPFRSVFDLVWSGRRHVMMGATQIDQYGNQNISCIGDWQRPKVQLLGSRGGPGNTVNHATSYWIGNHSKRVFVEEVDFVSGVGYAPDRWDALLTNLSGRGISEQDMERAGLIAAREGMKRPGQRRTGLGSINTCVLRWQRAPVRM